MAKYKEEMAGIVFDNTGDTPMLDSDDADYIIPFDKGEDYFRIYDNYVHFVKGCEDLVRTDPFYPVYIKYLIEVVGMKVCQVLPGIEVTDTKDVTIEMHHGPVLTLFQTCAIVLDHLRWLGDPNITTYKVADLVIEEHRLNHVRVMLACKTVHDQITLHNIKLNYNMGVGDTNAFLTKYPVHDKGIRNHINEYIEWSKHNDSFDNHVLEISKKLQVWGNNDADQFNTITLKPMS